MGNRTIKKIVDAYRRVRLEKRLHEWGRTRRRELDTAERGWSDLDAERITAALQEIDSDGHDPLAEASISDARIDREFAAVTASLRQVDEVIDRMSAGLQLAIDAHESPHCDHAMLEQAYGRKVVEKTVRVKKVPPFDGIGEFLWERFPRLVSLGQKRPVPYPWIVMLIFASGCTTAYYAATGHLMVALVMLLFTAVIDCLDGILVRASRRNVGAGKYVICLVSHAVDLIMLFGLATYVMSEGNPTIALVVAASAVLAIYGSFTRTTALRVGVRIDRSLVERMFRFAGLFLAFAFDEPLFVPALIVPYAAHQVYDVIRRVAKAQVWGVAIAVDGAEGRAEARAWAWLTDEDDSSTQEKEVSMTS